MSTPFDSPLLTYQLHCELLLISYSLHPSDPTFGTTQFFGTHFAHSSSDFVAGKPGSAHPLGGDIVISPTVGATVTVSINSDDNFLVEYKIDFSGNIRKRSIVVPPGASVPFLLNAKPFAPGATLSGRSAVLQGTLTATERASTLTLSP